MKEVRVSRDSTPWQPAPSKADQEALGPRLKSPASQHAQFWLPAVMDVRVAVGDAEASSFPLL
jgi:hypothetical protein